MQKLLKILIIILKNLGIFIGSSIATSLLFFLSSNNTFADLINNTNVSVKPILIIPVLFIYFIRFGIAGGLFGVAVYNLVRLFKSKEEPPVATI